jgi:type II secretory pathway pseudopilin PulG
MTMIEVVIALGIMAAVAVIFLVGMTTSSRAVIVSQEQVTGESLAKSQMESIKQQDYRVSLQYDKLVLSQEDINAGYDIVITAERLNPRGDAEATDDGLQKITVTVTRAGNTVFTLEGYKYLLGQ